ncbi:hypothetical protein GUJ93_ZPchr0006g43755 [Zizania palustris]|uniref:Uncharacterized protein n=1 Tax=Zizania palustris TaxID=103762 RepID=A0A8J5SYT1_ZIZPA|nr:hypothetical protein GUJ93_ZPchr0006g43755 [Zizania palustris]KAG8069701.1 hypothetical protein GUJ93_ZPchr0006g43755 [Zizania palustris]
MGSDTEMNRNCRPPLQSSTVERIGSVHLQMFAIDFQRAFNIHDKLYIGLSGLAADAQTLYQWLVFRHKLYLLWEERDVKPQHLLASSPHSSTRKVSKRSKDIQCSSSYW